MISRSSLIISGRTRKLALTTKNSLEFSVATKLNWTRMRDKVKVDMIEYLMKSSD